MFKPVVEFLWPTLVPLTAAEQAAQQTLIQGMRARVDGGDWKNHSEVALEEARRIYDSEMERRKGADAKAGIYLAAITALIPVLALLLPALFGEKVDKALGGISLLIFGAAITYLIRAGYWAFRTLKVSGIDQLGPDDIAACWTIDKPVETLAKTISLKVLSNYAAVNKKISCIRITHDLLLYAFFTFAVLLAIQAIWPTAFWLLELIRSQLPIESSYPLIMCYS